ncbi:tRNA (cytidine(34)-2'-O)-methyltransferase [Eggerthella sinensis]|uniref:tRNA (cytidine(34)-2'-O)-methyltransferase n=1 Tax=Eggerthella sinensis TaxID=242230 RepID=UPI0022E4E008|nr:TrmH family RNA methyltransferase [Eggerthella sinensis]
MEPLNIVLVEPEIPQNTGNIARTCACTGARLHLVEPMGFRLTQKQLARAGCDYWDEVDIVRWPCAAAFFEAHAADELHLSPAMPARSFADVSYGEGAFLVFGRESRGLDATSSRRTPRAASASPCATACAAST